METVVLNNEMQLSYPDGFHVMSEEELSKMTFYGEAPGWCISDPERHIDLSVSWKKTNGLFAKILNTREIAKNMEAQIRKPMGQYGYRLDSFLEKELGGRRERTVICTLMKCRGQEWQESPCTSKTEIPFIIFTAISGTPSGTPACPSWTRSSEP